MYMVGLLKDMFSRLEPILFVKNNDIDKDINRTSNHIKRKRNVSEIFCTDLVKKTNMRVK